MLPVIGSTSDAGTPLAFAPGGSTAAPSLGPAVGADNAEELQRLCAEIEAAVAGSEWAEADGLARALSKQLRAISSSEVAEGGDAAREQARLCYLDIAERLAVKLLGGEHLIKGRDDA